MVQLVEADIRTREVLAWKGLHVFHAQGSSCSQKLRIFLNLKGIPWKSHLIDLGRNENLGDFYLGINPRGLVPTIVHNGAVHIESNDIILYIERNFPQPSLVPLEHRGDIAELLKHEDDLHMDLRNLTFRFMLSFDAPPKSSDDLQRYGKASSGTVRGERDLQIGREISFWSDYARQGVTDASARDSARRFQASLQELDQQLAHSEFLLGNTVSILDVAWFVYVQRLTSCAYPIARLHPRVHAWATSLWARPEFAQEVALPPAIRERIAAYQRDQEVRGATLEAVSGFA